MRVAPRLHLAAAASAGWRPPSNPVQGRFNEIHAALRCWSSPLAGDDAPLSPRPSAARRRRGIPGQMRRLSRRSSLSCARSAIDCRRAPAERVDRAAMARRDAVSEALRLQESGLDRGRGRACPAWKGDKDARSGCTGARGSSLTDGSRPAVTSDGALLCVVHGPTAGWRCEALAARNRYTTRLPQPGLGVASLRTIMPTSSLCQFDASLAGIRALAASMSA